MSRSPHSCGANRDQFRQGLQRRYLCWLDSSLVQRKHVRVSKPCSLFKASRTVKSQLNTIWERCRPIDNGPEGPPRASARWFFGACHARRGLGQLALDIARLCEGAVTFLHFSVRYERSIQMTSDDGERGDRDEIEARNGAT